MSFFTLNIIRQWAPHEHNSLYILYQSFWNFAFVFSIFWRCACAPDIILALILSLLFYTLWTFVIFWPQMYREWVPCDCNFSYNFIPVFFNLCSCFFKGLYKCMWFRYNFLIYFCHFSTSTLSFSYYPILVLAHGQVNGQNPLVQPRFTCLKRDIFSNFLKKTCSTLSF